MAIRNLTEKTWQSFSGGRYTRSNLVAVSEDHVLIARDVIFPGDGIGHKRPGYTKISAAAAFAGVTSAFDFHRQSDGAQFLILAGSGKLGYIPIAPGGQLGAYVALSTTENPAGVFQFATNNFACYCSNGFAAYRLIDTGNGGLTLRNWGIQAPAAAPTISSSAGTLTIVNGFQYAYSFVAKWTDSQGTQRVHVGPPSPLSASTGPLTSVLVQLSALANSPDPQVTHIWIWRTNDTPFNTTSVLFFLAEITDGTSSYGDALADTSLDTTRQIPYDNQPAPAGGILAEYQQRIAVSGIAGKPDLVQASGLEEVALGIPQESFPSFVFFNVPGGSKAVSGMKPFDQQLMIGSVADWFDVTGISAETFQEYDNIFKPGPVGKKAILVTPTWMVWLGVDRKLWAWSGQGQPIEVSWKIARADGSDQLSMESIDVAQLANAELRWYSFGRYNFVLAFVASQPNSGYYDWCQLWDVSVLASPQGPFGNLSADGKLMGAAESDAFFTDKICATCDLLLGNEPFIALIDLAGNVYRWPDGFTDNGYPYEPVMGSEYSDLDGPDLVKRMRWADVKTSRLDAKDVFEFAAVVGDGVGLDVPKPVNCPVGPVPAQYGITPTTFRAKLEQRGTAIGRLLRWFITFPQDEFDAEVYQVLVKFSIVGKDPR